MSNYEEDGLENVDWELALKRLQVSQIVANTIVNSGPEGMLEDCRREDGSLRMKDIIRLQDVKKFLDVFVEMVDWVSPEEAEGVEETIHGMMWMQ